MGDENNTISLGGKYWIYFDPEEYDKAAIVDSWLKDHRVAYGRDMKEDGSAMFIIGFSNDKQDREIRMLMKSMGFNINGGDTDDTES